MQDTVMRNPRMDAHGKVTLEYISKDGKSRAITTENMAFNHAWNENFVIADFLRYSGSAQMLLLTDYTGEVNPHIPLIPGNMVGYAQTGAGTDGIYRGAEIVAKREQAISKDGVITDKRVFEFTSSQVPGDIHTIGYTKQWYSCRLTYNEGYVAYTLHDSNPNNLLQNAQSIGVFDLVNNTAIRLYTLSFDYSNKRFTLIVDDVHPDNSYEHYTIYVPYDYNSSMTIAQTILVLDIEKGSYQVVSDCYYYDYSISKYVVNRFFIELSTSLNQATISNTITLYVGNGSYSSSDVIKHYIYPFGYSKYVTTHGFKYNGKYYLHAAENSTTRSGLYEAVLDTPHEGGTTQLDFVRYIPYQLPVNSEARSPSANTASYMGNKIISYRGHGNYGFTFYNLDDLDRPMGTIASKNLSNFSIHSYRIKDYGEDSELLFTYNSGSYASVFSNYMTESCGALTWFKVPDDAPKREEGDGIRITYEITFTPVKKQ